MAVITLNDGTELHAADGLSSEQYKDIVDSYYESIGGSAKQQPQQPTQQKEKNDGSFWGGLFDTAKATATKGVAAANAVVDTLSNLGADTRRESIEKQRKMLEGTSPVASLSGFVGTPSAPLKTKEQIEQEKYNTVKNAVDTFEEQNKIIARASEHSPVGSFIGQLAGGIPTFLAQPVAAGMERAYNTESTASGLTTLGVQSALNLIPGGAAALNPLKRIASGAAIAGGGYIAGDLLERGVDSAQGIKDKTKAELGSEDWWKGVALQSATNGVLSGVLGERAPTKREMNKVGQSALDDVLGSIFQERTDAASREVLLQEQRQAAIQQEAARRNLVEKGKQPTLANSIDEMLNIAAESDIKKRSKARQKDIESVFNEQIPLHDERGNLSGKSITTGERLLETVPGKDLEDFLKSKELTRAYETDKSLGRVGDNFNEQLNADVPNQVAISKRMLENEALNETTTLGASPAERQVEIAKKIIESPEWTTEGGQSLRNKANIFDTVDEVNQHIPFLQDILGQDNRLGSLKNDLLVRNTLGQVPIQDKGFAKLVFDAAAKDHNAVTRILSTMDKETSTKFLEAIRDGSTKQHQDTLIKSAATDAFIKSRLDPQFIEKSLGQTGSASEAAATPSQRNEWNPRVVHTEGGTIIKNLTPIEMHQAEAMGAQRVEGSLDYFVPESKATYKQLPDGSFIFCE